MKKQLSIIAVILFLGNFQSVKAQDMGASALVAPTSSICAAANQTVTITITNNDVNPIDFSINNCPVTVSISGPIAQSYTTVVSTGTLAASGTQNIMVTTVADFSTAGTYTIDANTTLAGDINSGNDAMASVDVTVNALPNVTISATKTTLCAGKRDTLTASGAVSYTWTPGNSHAISIKGVVNTS